MCALACTKCPLTVKGKSRQAGYSSIFYIYAHEYVCACAVHTVHIHYITATVCTVYKVALLYLYNICSSILCSPVYY